MTDRKPRIAVVGCGGFATTRLYPSIRLAGSIELAAVCDIVEEKARDAAARFGAGAHYTDMDAMLDAEAPDGVCVIGPAPMQYELGKHVLERGFPLYTEKPCAMTSADADEMADLAEAKGLITGCGFMKRHSAPFRAARDIIGREEFGPPRFIEVRFTQGPYAGLWGVERGMRVSLIGQFVHLFDLMRFLVGEVESVQARLYEHPDDPAYGAFAVTLVLANGGLGVINLNMLESDGWHFNEYVRVTGFQHWLDVEDMLRLRYHPLQGWTEQHDLKNQTMRWEPSLDLETEMLRRAGYVGEIADFARCCLTGQKPVAGSRESADALRIGEAIWASAMSSGAEVKVGEAPAVV